MAKSKHTMQRLVANQYGIKYAKEAFEFHKEFNLLYIDWEAKTGQIRERVMLCYHLDTGDENTENLDEAANQAESTWRYLWSENSKNKK